VGSMAWLLPPSVVSPGAETRAELATPGMAEAPTLTVREKLMLEPAPRAPAWVAVTSCPEAEKLHPAPEPETKPSPGGSVTVTVKLVLWPAARVPAWVAVTICPEAEKLHPAPEPETKPSPGGRVSVTVTGPVVAPEPWLVTERV